MDEVEVEVEVVGDEVEGEAVGEVGIGGRRFFFVLSCLIPDLSFA